MTIFRPIVVRPMTPSPFGPLEKPHRTKIFWICVGLTAVFNFCAPPILEKLLRLPPLHWRAATYSFGAAFILMLPVWWIGFRFGRVAWLAIGLIMFSIGLTLRLLS